MLYQGKEVNTFKQFQVKKIFSMKSSKKPFEKEKNSKTLQVFSQDKSRDQTNTNRNL